SAIAAMSRMPARLMPEYQEDVWVVRGKFCRILKTMKLTTSASKPKRIITNTARLLKIRAPTQPTGSNPMGNKSVNKRTHATAAAHSLRSKARRRTKTNRAQKPENRRMDQREELCQQ